MPQIRTIINLMIFTVIVVLMVLGTRWHDGYKKEKEEIKFIDYIKTDLKNIEEGIGSIPKLLSDAVASGNAIKKSYVDKMAEVVEIYANDTGKYPDKLSELVPSYIDEKTLNQKIFYYKKFGNGYEMGITLENGKVYKIKK